MSDRFAPGPEGAEAFRAPEPGTDALAKPVSPVVQKGIQETPFLFAEEPRAGKEAPGNHRDLFTETVFPSSPDAKIYAPYGRRRYMDSKRSS